MSGKFLNTIQQFSQSDLTEFLQKNGHSEFIEILNKGEITNGEKFLEINELQMLKWKLPLATKRQLLALLSEIKKNPQRFLEKADKDKTVTINRRQSFTRAKPGFIEKLQETIINPKPPEHPATKPKLQPPLPHENQAHTISPKPRPPLPTPPINLEFPTEDYLDMDPIKTESPEDHYDESGYLLPSAKANHVEENDYEPPPSHSTVFSTSPRNISISERAPLALPRESTDERGYIRGPFEVPKNEEPHPKLLPRVQNSQRSISPRPPVKAPSPIMPRQVVTPRGDEESDEELPDYELIDDQETVVRNASPQSKNMEMNTDSLSRKLLRIFKNKSKKPEMQNTESESKASEERNELKKSTESLSSKRGDAVNYMTRPLPPLPALPQRQPQPQVTKEEQPTASYVNIKRNVHPTNTPKGHGMTQSVKLKSENASTPAKETPVYGNCEQKKETNLRESYEKYHFKSKSGKKAQLPLPPPNLPQLKLHPENTSGDSLEAECEEYGNYVCNLNDEPFFRNTDRKGARLLLLDLDDGAFLFRPSSQFFLTLSLKYHGQCFNLGVQKTDKNRIKLNTDGDISPEFATLTEFVEHFTTELLTFKHKNRVIEVLLTKTLPMDRF